VTVPYGVIPDDAATPRPVTVLASAKAGTSVPSSDRLLPLWSLWVPLVLLLFLALAAQIDPDWYDRTINSEQGLIELAQATLVGAGFVVALTALPAAARARPRWLLGWIGLAALCCLYVAGEEISWGQHLFGWSTPAEWIEINDQDETNLHNVSGWFDQKPRWLLGLGIGIGGFALPLLALRWPALRQGWIAPILPPLATVPVAAMAILVGAVWTWDDFVGELNLFERPSEVQEFYFYYFVLLYLLVMRRRLRGR